MKEENVTRFSVSLQKASSGSSTGWSGKKAAPAAHWPSPTWCATISWSTGGKLGDCDAAGAVTLVYDHHKPHLQESLTGIQHKHRETIVSTLHVHLDHHNCLEVLVVRGKASAIKAIADRLIGAKGVKHGKLSITTTGKDLPA